MSNPELDTSPIDGSLKPCDCPFCLKGMLYPVDWDENEQDKELWDVDLRCPECDWRGTAVFDDSKVEYIDRQLDDATDILLQNLRRLAVENMAEWVENCANALRAGAILPEDFHVQD